MVGSLDTLNPEQQEAVTTIGENIIVFAGPGTGKTKTLTHKVQYLLEARIVKPYRKILAITFTNKAAGEMLSRVRETVRVTEQVRVTTFHRFCSSVLRSYGDLIDLDRDFSIISQKQALSLATELMDKYKLPFRRPRHFLSRISQLKNASENYSSFVASLESPVVNIKPAVFEYERVLREGHFMDFDDLILNTLTLFHERPDVLQVYRLAFPLLLIDEMQDTNRAQLTLIKMLGEHAEHVMAVADDDQMIYRWRGALPTVIQEFISFFNARTIKLTENYRSPEIVLKVGTEIIEQIDNRIPKRVVGRPTSAEDCAEVHVFKHYEDEASWVAAKVKELLDSGTPHRQIAILYRRFHPSFRIFEKIFEAMGVRFQFVQKGIDTDNFSLADLILEAGNLIVHPDNVMSLKSILDVLGARYGLDVKLSEDYKNRLCVSDKELLDRLSVMEPEDKLDSLIVEFCQYVKQQHSQVDHDSVYDDLYRIFRIDGALAAFNEDARRREVENLAKLKQRWSTSQARNLVDLLSEIRMESDVDSDSGEEQVVRGFTIHAAKGLEFSVVFIIGLEKFLIPGTDPSESELADERRNLYVGITRAKSKLFMSYALQRPTLFGNLVPQEPCPFLCDIESAVVYRHL